MNAGEGASSRNTVGGGAHSSKASAENDRAPGSNGQEEQNRDMNIDQEDNAEEQPTILVVKTKTRDGGSQVSSSTRRNGRDSFLHYSNDAVRMRHLLGLEAEEPAVNGGDAQGHEAGGDAEATTRKTRISFELHDSLLFYEYAGPLEE